MIKGFVAELLRDWRASGKCLVTSDIKSIRGREVQLYNKYSVFLWNALGSFSDNRKKAICEILILLEEIEICDIFRENMLNPKKVRRKEFNYLQVLAERIATSGLSYVDYLRIRQNNFIAESICDPLSGHFELQQELIQLLLDEEVYIA